MERMEEIKEITMDGFQVVSGDYFTSVSKLSVPSLTIWDGTIGFTKQDALMLNLCECILMQINPKEKGILLSTSNSSDKDAIKWLKKTNPIETRKLACQKLTDKIYSMWGWDKDYVYRAPGRLVTSSNKVMLYFDFSDPEKWKRPEARNVG